MRPVGFIVPAVMALVNVPFFPGVMNIGAFGLCAGLAIYAFITWLHDH